MIKATNLIQTGIAWIPEIPSNWELKRIKLLFDFNKNIVGKTSGDYDVLSLTTKGVIKRDLESGMGKFPASFDGYQIVKPNSIMLCLFDMDVTPRVVGHVDDDGIISAAYTNIIPKKGINSKYYYYYFLLQDKNKSLLALGTGIRITLNKDFFGTLKIPVPPLEEQKEISAYLDKKNNEIDKFIRNKERLIELLEEELSHFISEKVSNPKTGWENKKIKYASKVFRGKFTHRPRNDESLYDGEYPFIQTGDVARANKYITEYSQTLNKLGYKVTTEFPKGTIVMTIAANIGDVAILGFNACFPDSVIGFYPKKNILNDFLYYALKVKKDDFLQTAIVNTQMNLNVERVSSVFIDIPPFSEQQKIVFEIEEHEKYIQNAISKAQKEISSIKEYREALITDLVTGKRAVGESFKTYKVAEFQ